VPEWHREEILAHWLCQEPMMHDPLKWSNLHLKRPALMVLMSLGCKVITAPSLQDVETLPGSFSTNQGGS